LPSTSRWTPTPRCGGELATIVIPQKAAATDPVRSLRTRDSATQSGGWRTLHASFLGTYFPATHL
jgi:hypothetical protein